MRKPTDRDKDGLSNEQPRERTGEQPAEKVADPGAGQTNGLAKEPHKGLFQRLNDNLYEFYVAPYRRTFARAQRDEEDLFMLLVFAESLGVPNPAAYYTMELLPVVYERFHEWHKRMGIEKSPLDHVHCC